ncbi:hypothetical protein J6590_030797 [Homalodisca vitripennis]|nr:hypothetical protein J6590_030797 [Homalodisca vitripennis]
MRQEAETTTVLEDSERLPASITNESTTKALNTRLKHSLAFRHIAGRPPFLKTDPGVEDGINWQVTGKGPPPVTYEEKFRALIVTHVPRKKEKPALNQPLVKAGRGPNKLALRLRISTFAVTDVPLLDIHKLAKNKNSSITREHGEYKKQTRGRTERAEDHPIEERVYREKMTIAASGPGLGTMQLNTSANRNYER